MVRSLITKARTSVSDWHRASAGHRPRSSAFAVAAAIGVSAAVLALGIDRISDSELEIRKIAKSAAPQLDGDSSDPAWIDAPMVTVHTAQGANFGGTGRSTVQIRAVHDGETAYFLFTWDDPTRSLKYLPLKKTAAGWQVLQTKFGIEDEDTYYEDKFAVMLSRSPSPGGGAAHLGPAPLAGKPAAFSARGLHYTSDGGIVDVWHWKSARGGLLGYMDDNYFGAPGEPTPEEVAGTSRYKAGYKTDPGKAIYSLNHKQRPPGGYNGTPVEPIRLPKDLAVTQAAMKRIDLDPDHSEEDGAWWWMTEAESTPFSPEADAAIPVGAVIPGVVIAGAYAGDRADVRAAARWAAGRWTLEVARKLDTGSKYDLPIETGVHMWVSAFDHSQTRHTRHERPIAIKLTQ